jgi:hypothetical protein
VHGAYALVKLEPRAAELADEIRELVPASHPADEITVRLLALALAQVEAATSWVAEHGLVDEHGNPRGVLRHLGTMMNTAARIADRLGMTPTWRRRGPDCRRLREARHLRQDSAPVCREVREPRGAPGLPLRVAHRRVRPGAAIRRGGADGGRRRAASGVARYLLE